jgi:uroporphyrinogen decarboxylase
MTISNEARALAGEARRNGGLAPVDLDRFWADQAAAAADPFGLAIPQVPLGIDMTPECVFGELGVAEDYTRLQFDTPWRRSLVDRYNTEARRIVGKPVLDDRPPSAEPEPGRRQLYDLFEATNKWNNDSYWLMPSASTEEELAALLDRVETRLADRAGLRRYLFDDEWLRRRDYLLAVGKRPAAYRAQRGPVTFATSIYGAESLIFLIADRPDLACRFRDAILHAIVAVAEAIDLESGYGPGEAPRGWYWSDDNSALLSPGMYELFGYPILAAVFERFSPDPGDRRGQHSDSAMGHLLPLLGRLGMTEANFGPGVPVAEIRRHLPRAAIYGRLAPFTFAGNDGEQIVEEFLRDFAEAREKRGLVFATAGSVNDGSRLASLRLIMAAIQRHGRY